MRLFEIPSSARIQLTCLREKPENKYFVEVAAFDAVLFHHFVHREHIRESKNDSQPDIDFEDCLLLSSRIFAVSLWRIANWKDGV